MTKEILKDYGWYQVIRKESEYFLRFDKGGIAIKKTTYKISESEANISISNEIKAEEIAKTLLIDKSKKEIGSI